ncbi:hypothetical protein ACROSR_08815 [Roseovarius tibetensis]|uniref:hypothetical protein n=1 Tax=Roseovarius tibetensis TaxID=2685897 RepID=UPI003D7F25C8
MIFFAVGKRFDALKEIQGLDHKVATPCQAESYLEALNMMETLSEKGFNHVKDCYGWVELGIDDLWIYIWRCIVVHYLIPGNGRGETFSASIIKSQFCPEGLKVSQITNAIALERLRSASQYREWE